MILLWGPITDQPLEKISSELKKLKADFIVLNQFDILDMDISLTKDEAFLIYKNEKIDLTKIKSVYLRPFISTQMPDVDEENPQSESYLHAQKFDDLMYSWIESTNALVINLPSAMSSNSSKPYQTELIRSTGIKVPTSLVTTDADEVKKFHKKHGEIIYKSISGVRSIVSKFTKNDYSRLDKLVWCPTQFQEYLTGTDWRVHVVGDKIFPCRIETTASADYRYASKQGGETRIYPDEIPKNIEKICFEISKKLNLPVVGIDLRLTDDGTWYCFEANPSPGFTYYEGNTGLPIGNAIATLLNL